ncbi:hypothetical protein [uncultured Cetobacterium sp.]|uniref:hypothetical protein n=1 Tax=uncultured Cetobacterium sp. TaxID=527638 RepID=UPI00262F8A93|nr:hypothetical protein [uncultured Cetobacterium sp.]
MRKKLSLFLLLSIISIFGSIREEIKDRSHLYTFVNSEIKESKNNRNDKHILLNISNKDIKIITTSSRDKKDDDLGNDDSVTYLINSSFSPIFRINLKEVSFFNFYLNNNLIYTILNRYENRVLRI